jgi:hypothetical protein
MWLRRQTALEGLSTAMFTNVLRLLQATKCSAELAMTSPAEESLLAKLDNLPTAKTCLLMALPAFVSSRFRSGHSVSTVLSQK